MACYHPVRAYRAITKRNPNGKQIIKYKLEDIKNVPYEKVWLPCGSCIGCRIARSRSWALRCVHESTLHEENSFITLTFNEDTLDAKQSLVKSDFQKFMKRLRKHFSSKKIRYFHCGEYGSQLLRPHHHAALFGIDFVDKYLWKIKKGVKLYRSPTLEKLWPFGYSTIGDLNYKSAAYIARYCMKKINGKKSILHYSFVDQETGEMTIIEPEYITMSRRPGIAREWFEKYKNDVFPKDNCHVDGREFRPPKYYDYIYDSMYPEEMSKIKRIRLDNMRKCTENYTPERLKAREGVLMAKVSKLERSYERTGL